MLCIASGFCCSLAAAVGAGYEYGCLVNSHLYPLRGLLAGSTVSLCGVLAVTELGHARLRSYWQRWHMWHLRGRFRGGLGSVGFTVGLKPAAVVVDARCRRLTWGRSETLWFHLNLSGLRQGLACSVCKR